ncbi:MAG: hypothetical protein QM762_30145 [Chryseolinea sp.]
MKTYLPGLISAAMLIGGSAFSQTPTLDVSGAGVGSYGTVKYTDPTTVGKTIKPDVTYEDVRGRYMWDNDWHKGYLVLKGGNRFNLDNIKLNLYTQDVHYIANGAELVADKSLVKDLVLFGKDTTQVLATFHAFVPSGKKTTEWYQQMNIGATQLLKKQASHVNKLPYDPSVGKTEYRFVTETEYYLLDKQKVQSLPALNKTSVNSVIPIDGEADKWLGSHKNKLKSEEDVVSFLDFHNARP